MTAEDPKSTMIQITPKDEELIALLKADSREPVAVLARKLGLSRTTVQDRLARLKEAGVIAAFTIRLAREAEEGGMRAFVTLAIEPRRQVELGRRLAHFHQVETLHTVSGKFDLIAQVRTNSSQDMDRLIDEIGQIPGVTRIETSVILSTKLDRR
jgi:DNA-binding Lrp family transcriptional regulator